MALNDSGRRISGLIATPATTAAERALEDRTGESGQSTAKRAAKILVAKNVGFVLPTAKQRQNLLVACAKRGMVVYGRAFDILKLSEAMDLDDLPTVERNLDKITVYEIKSTRKTLAADFSGYFFGLSGAEMLVAQSMKHHFRFAFVNTVTEDFIELTLGEVFARAKGIYPTWSIMF